jgi:hypothetical protein
VAEQNLYKTIFIFLLCLEACNHTNKKSLNNVHYKGFENLKSSFCTKSSIQLDSILLTSGHYVYHLTGKVISQNNKLHTNPFRLVFSENPYILTDCEVLFFSVPHSKIQNTKNWKCYWKNNFRGKKKMITLLWKNRKRRIFIQLNNSIKEQ